MHNKVQISVLDIDTIHPKDDVIGTCVNLGRTYSLSLENAQVGRGHIHTEDEQAKYF